MQDIRLIGLDLDGTVFDDAKHISPRNLAAIEAAVQAGIIVPVSYTHLTLPTIYSV